MSFVSYTPRPGVTPRSTSFVFDPQSLDKIRNQVKEGNPNGNKEVAKQFESLFIQMLLKQARSAGLHSDALQSESVKMSQSMHDEQLALELAQGPGMGLADALIAMMNKGLGKEGGPADEAGLALAGSSARVAGMKSELPLQREKVADSLDALIDLITTGVDKLKNATYKVSQLLPTKSAPEHVAAFVEKVGDAVVAAAKDSGLPAQLIMSQAALESGWGKHEIKHEDGTPTHNIFGIKATPNWKGKVVHVTTTEFVGGVPKKVSQPFRVYDSYEDSIADYTRLLSTSDRYAGVTKANDAHAAAREVQRAGYATDPNYADKLISIMSYFKAA